MMQKPWRRWTSSVDDDQLPKRRTQSSSAELQPAGLQRRRRLLAKDRYRSVEALIPGKESELSMGLVDPRVGLGWCRISDYIVQHRQCS